ncbi:MAG: hypothetical protein ACKVP0_12190 [Pirellulaceae bacterium]
MRPLPQTPAPFQEDRKWLLIGAVAAGIFVIAGNLAHYPLTEEQSDQATVLRIYLAVWGGVLFGQVGLTAIWLGLGRPSALVRVVGAGVAYVVFAGSYLTGYLVRESFKIEFISFDGMEQHLAVILSIPILIVTAASPLWLLRLFFGWHIQHQRVAVPRDSRQYSIGSLILLTTLIAVLLGIGLQACRLSEEQPRDFCLILGAWCLSALILAATTLLPASLFLSQYPLLGLGILAGVAACLYGVVIWWIIQIALSFGGKLSDPDIWGFLGLCGCPILGFLVTLGLPLVAMRRCGYRLVIGGNSGQAKSV